MRSDKNNQFLRHNLIFFIGTGIMGVLNYVYYPLMGRLLDVAQFGEVQALFSILTELSILFAALGLVIVHITVNARRHEANALLLELERVGALTLVFTGVIWLAAVGFISHFLKFTDQLAVALFYAAVFLSYFSSTRQAALQGSEDFAGLAKSGVFGTAVKLVGSLVLVMLGYGVLGAILGLILGQLVMLGYALIISLRHGFALSVKVFSKVDWQRLKPEVHYVIPVFVVSLGVTLLFTSDVLVIKHFFSPQVAGSYAGVAAIGRIIIFLTASINGVLFTKVKPELTPEANRRILRNSSWLFLLLGGSGCAVMVAAPHLVVLTLLGDRYLEQAANLPLLAVTLFLLAGFNLVAYYDLALRRKRAAVITAGGVIAAFIGVAGFHATVQGVILDILYATIGMITVRGLLSIRSLQRIRGQRGETDSSYPVNYHTGL